MLEQKVKQAAQSLYRLENAASKRQRSNSSVNANSHLDTAQKKCDEISAELWRLQSLEMDIERRLMNHNAAVLGLGMNIMEKKAMEGRMICAPPAGTMDGTYISMLPKLFFGTMPFTIGGGTYSSVWNSEYRGIVEDSSSPSSDGARFRLGTERPTGCSDS